MGVGPIGPLGVGVLNPVEVVCSLAHGNATDQDPGTEAGGAQVVLRTTEAAAENHVKV